MKTQSSSYVRFCVTAASGLFLTAGFAHAGASDELAKLMASDGAPQDLFGRSVAISGTTAIVGAQGNDNSVPDSGAAYLFDTTSGLQIAKLLASDGAINDYFGTSVAISGTTVIIGADGHDHQGSSSGSAYLFDTTTGLQIAELLADDGAPFDLFGSSVAISGTTAIVGAPQGNDKHGNSTGAAYLFDTTTGLQIAKLLADHGVAFDYFGVSVAISGTTAIVGAYAHDSSGKSSGTAYLFDTTTGLQTAKLLASDGAPFDLFGSSVAINGTTAIVGAHYNDDNGSLSGSAYLFDTTTGLQIAKLLASDGAAFDEFGLSVAISETTAMVGARNDDDNGLESGSAYLFDTTTGSQVEKLLASDGVASDFFGFSVAISGTTAIVGAWLAGSSGSAYLFHVAAPPALSGDVLSISLGSGGSQVLTLDGGPARAGWSYFMLGSVTGTTPGLNFGGSVSLPLNFDAYFNLTLTSPDLGIFGNFRSVLDGVGHAVATVSLPVIMDPSLVGITLNHAYLSAAVIGVAPFVASNAVPVLLAP